MKKLFCMVLTLALLAMPTAVFPASAATALPRITTSGGEFYKNSAVWHPAGMNYTQVKSVQWQQYDSYGNYVTSLTDLSHSTLLVNSFDASKVTGAFANISNDGYNYVRIMINPEGVGTADKTYYGIGGPYTVGANHKYGLYIPYMNNVVQLLQIARQYNLYVIPCLNYLPYNMQYQSTLVKPIDGNGKAYIDDVNLLYMNQPHINAKTEYIKNFIQYIKDADSSLLSTILSYDFMNEVHVISTAAPFSRSDTVTTADGAAYNMAVDAQRQQCVDANMVNWANQCKAAVLSKDSQGMGDVSLFTFHAIGLNAPNGVHPSSFDSRNPVRPDVLSLYSNVNFIDFHLYPDSGTYTVDNDLNSSLFSYINQQRTPLVLGEFGAAKFMYSNVSSAAYAMKDMKNNCKSKGFKGWSLWTWDSNQPEWYNATQDGGAINGQLAPVVWGW